MEDPAGKKSLFEHASELRRRLLNVALILIAGTFVFAAFSKEIFLFLQRPLLGSSQATFVALSPLEGWTVYLKVAFFTSIFATAPLWFYQLWAFMAPALAKKERRLISIAGFFSAACFIAGGLFGFFVVLPAGFHYLVYVFNGTGIELMTQMQWYLSFVTRFLVAFGIVFETPLMLVLLASFGIVTVNGLRRARRYVIVGIFVIAAAITPGPDVISQISCAVPLVLFYEAGIITATIVCKKRQSVVVSSGTV